MRQKVRHTKIESSLVKQQTLLCKQLVEEVVKCRRSQSVARRVLSMGLA